MTEGQRTEATPSAERGEIVCPGPPPGCNDSPRQGGGFNQTTGADVDAVTRTLTTFNAVLMFDFWSLGPLLVGAIYEAVICTILRPGAQYSELEHWIAQHWHLSGCPSPGGDSGVLI